MSEQINTLNKDGGSNLDTTQKVDIGSLNSRLSQIELKAKELEGEIKQSKFDLITLIGVFVGLITYLGLEVQVFKSINNPLLIIGISIFFIASILLFVLSINSIIKKIELLTWRDFNNPIYIILIILLLFSIFFIIIGYSDYYSHQGISPRIHFLNSYGN